jgi:TolB-like protein/tetratricopeptide (TPR) repeat protein/predicted Ser/Thr protein kinase
MSSLDQSRQAVDGQRPRGQASSDELERWGRVKAVFLAALERPDSERSAFVAETCADDSELMNEIESLLASDKAAASFCETPAAGLLRGELPTGSEPGPRLPAGTRLGAYEITAFIAAGGMGEVYRAWHTVLGRQVAIKTVGAQLSDDAARRRLIREAQHASVLAHPSICAIYEVGEADGLPFIVMEYVDGRPLSEIVREAIPPLRVSLDYGIQIASALEHAHRHGIVHRDLKSANVVIDADGTAKVLDFGLARRLPGTSSPSGESTVTAGDALAGTLSHMAPETLRGERADARSDVWALGVLLYELVMGELPFQGRTPFETSSAILGEPPRPMSTRVPLALRLVIERCLVKDPNGRYQRVRAVLDALDAIRRRRAWPVIGPLIVSARRRTLYVAAAAALLVPALVVAGGRLRTEFEAGFVRRISTLALLPLENATGDPRADYYAAGVTDALIAQLGAAADLRVLSRTSTTRIARNATTVREIGARLGADVIVQGALRRASERIALDMRLVRPSDGRVLWSESFERSARDVLALQADVVRALAVAVQLTLRPAARERLATVRAVSPDVYEEYLKGRFEWNKRTRASLELAVDHFRRAVELDPTYAPAHAALADCFNLLGTVMLGTGSPRDYRPRAAAEAIRALQIDPYSAEAHAALGYVWHYEWRWADAERELRRAVELNPSYSLARIWYANLLMSRSRMKEAIEQVYAARDLDPFSLIVNTNVGWILDRAGRHDDAVAHLKQTIAMDSSYVQGRWRLASALMSAGRFTEALDHVRRVVVLTDSSPSALAAVATIYGRAGRRDEAREILARLLDRSRHQYVSPASIASVFTELGDVEAAVTWYEKAFAEGSNAIAYLDEPGTAPLRHNRRFQSLRARAGLK